MTIPGSDIPRFSEPQSFYEDDTEDFSGRTAWVHVYDVDILDGLCTCRELRVEVIGDEDSYYLGDVRWERTLGHWHKLHSHVPTENLIIDAARKAVPRDDAVQALREAL